MPKLKGNWKKYAEEAVKQCQRFWNVSSCEECREKRLVQPCGSEELGSHPSEQKVIE